MLCQSYFKSGSVNQLSIKKKKIQGTRSCTDTRRSYFNNSDKARVWKKRDDVHPLVPACPEWIQKDFQMNFSVAASRGSLNLFDADVSAKTQRQRSKFDLLRHFMRPSEFVCYYVWNTCFSTAVAVCSFLGEILFLSHNVAIQYRSECTSTETKIKLTGDTFSKSVFSKSWFYNPCSTPLVVNNSVVSHNIFWQMYVHTFVRRSSWRCFWQHSIHAGLPSEWFVHICNMTLKLILLNACVQTWKSRFKKNHRRIIVPCQCGWNWRPDRPRESFCSYSLHTAWLQSRRAAAGDTIETLNTLYFCHTQKK